MSTDTDTPPLRPAVPPKRRVASLRAIAALVLREMSTTHGRSPGGYIWAILEPAAGIALLSAIFSLAFRSPGIGTNFPIFYATGMLPFILFMDVSNKVSQSLNFSKALLAYPAVSYIDALIARFLLNLTTQLMVGYILFTGILLAFETRTSPELSTIVEAYALVALLAGGIGTLNCFLIMRFPIWQVAWGILMRPMFIISGIFFIYDIIPQPLRDYLWYNPLIHVVGLMRRGFYPTYDATYVSVEYVAIIGLGCLLLGLVLLRRNYRDLLDR